MEVDLGVPAHALFFVSCPSRIFDHKYNEHLMIIIRLRGGLGNQLFQYAAGRALAVHHGVELKVDLYSYIRHPYRKFELGHFNLNISEATRGEIHRFTGSNPIIRFMNKRENYFRSPNVFAQPHYHFYTDFFSLPSEVYLSGYWQRPIHRSDWRVLHPRLFGHARLLGR